MTSTPVPPATYIPAAFNGSLRGSSGPPKLGVVHSMECPLEAGRAVSWARYLSTSGYHYYAPHYFDPDNSVRVGPDHLIYQHVGNGNLYGGSWSIGYEQSGYAAYTRDQWLTPAGRSQIARLSGQAAYDSDLYGIPKVWLSIADLRAGRSGFTSHANCSIALGGSDHTDPGPSWPIDLFLELITTGAPSAGKEDDMANVRFVRGKSSPDVYLVREDGTGPVHCHAGTLGDLAYMTTQAANPVKVLDPPKDAPQIIVEGEKVWIVSDALAASYKEAAGG